jgi:hypothetical protein
MLNKWVVVSTTTCHCSQGSSGTSSTARGATTELACGAAEAVPPTPTGDPGDDGAPDGLPAAAVDGEAEVAVAGAGTTGGTTGDDEFTAVVEGDVATKEAAMPVGELGPEAEEDTVPSAGTTAAGGENALVPSDRTPAADAEARRASTR